MRQIVVCAESYLMPRSKQDNDRKKEVCLIDAFRSLGIKQTYHCDGPFWALGDGKPMLQPHGFLGRKKFFMKYFVFSLLDRRLLFSMPGTLLGA